MKTKKDNHLPWQQEELPFVFERTKGSRILNGEVEKIRGKTLFFRSGNGKIIIIKMVEKLLFHLPRYRRIDVVVTGKPGSYILTRQRRRPPSAQAMIGG